jgi:ATP-dependent DNA helicase RecQ
MDGCERCDRCDLATRAEYVELSDDRQLLARKALAGVARTHERYGRGRVAEMLSGSQSAALRKSGLDRLSTFGLLQDQGKAFVTELLDCLEEAGLIRTVGTQYPLLGLTDAGNEVMQDRERAVMRWPKGAVGAASRSARREGPAEIPEGFDADLYTRLTDWRRAVAQANGRPPYTVFHDRTLKQLAARQPADEAELATISGIGPAKLEVYGPALLALVRGEEADVPVL